MKVILAEKPSVARDIARVVGASQKRNGWLEGAGYQVTWAFGHLVGIAEPSVMNERWGGKWSFAQLPMIPEAFQLATYPKSLDQFNTISRLFNGCDEIINATDAGREGELIFRWIYRRCGCQKPFKRLWISDLTDESIRDGLGSLHPGASFNPLGTSAQCRAFADWLVGLNATRAYSVRHGQLYTVGRVQTPTLALIVNRYELIQGFQKFYYYELHAQTRQVDFRWEDKDGYKIDAKERSEALKKKLDGKPGVITGIKKSKRKTGPLPLYDLTLLQKECNDKFGYTAKETLDLAQNLYEQHKLISYPRTESRHLSEKMRPQLPAILKNAPEALQPLAQESLQYLSSGHVLGKNYIDDKKLTDHHAIIPTGKKQQGILSDKLSQVYLLIQKRFISIFHPDFVEEVTEVILDIDGECFKCKGARAVEVGWRRVYQKDPQAPYPVRPEVQALLEAKFKKGETCPIDALDVQEKETAPPKLYTDGTLLNAMRYIGRQVDDSSLAARLKDQGLGTQATRASVIERLLKSEYIFRKGKSLIPTEKGIRLVHTVVSDLKSPELTAQWEQKLAAIQDGKLKGLDFMQEIEAFTKKIVPIIQTSRMSQSGYSKKDSLGVCPQCKKGQILEGRKAYYCAQYREGCPFVLWWTIAGKKISHAQARKIFKDGKSDLIKGFTSKAGKPFDARITLDKEYKTKFCFE